MKKITSFLLAVVMLLGCIPAMAETGTFTANADKYAITAYKGSDEHLVVPASVDGVATPIINRQALNGVKAAVTLSFEEGVTQIRSNNLNGLSITQLTLPSTLEVIGGQNIYQTDLLTEVTIPAAVSYVGNLAFSYCDALTKVTFTGLCPIFAPRCFVSTAGDLVVYVPDDQLDAYKAALPEGLNIQPSGQNAVDARIRVAESDFEFDAATSTITKYNGTASFIEIPATVDGVQVKNIGQKTFYQHPFITVVIVPEGVETLEMYSIFAGAGLYHVELPSTLKTIGNNALWGNDLDGLLLPDGLETIGDKAFTNSLNTKMNELVIPDSVTSIGKEAFSGCKPVKVVIGANVQSLPSKAFGTLHEVTEIVIRNKNGMTIDAEAFKSAKKGASITLMDGITEEVYNSYVEQLAVAYADATVNQPELAAGFPALDAEAGAPFIGSWYSVAGKDVMGDFTNAYPETAATLNADGTGLIRMDGDEIAVAWYVDSGYALFAPIAEDGTASVDQLFAFANIDENGRLFMDYGYAGAICEQEGASYAAPARPEEPWPEFDLSNATYFIGEWDAIEYHVEDEVYSVEMIGPMCMTLNDDGTALMAEGEEGTYELRWYAEYAVAYVGETMSEKAKITFDGTGNIKLELGDVVVILAPKAEATVIEGADELLGDWYDDIGNKLTLANDGTMTVTYASDGWVYEESWNVADGAAVVTAGRWEGAAIYMNDGIVFIDNGEGIFQLFSADGDLSAYYGEETEDELPEAQPIGAEGELYFGTWTMDLGGMAMNLILNQDGTCAMEMFGEAEPGVWTIENGKAYVMGDEIAIDGDGNLVMASQGMVFVKAETSASGEDELSEEEELLLLLAMLGEMEEEEAESEAADPCIGVRFEMTGSVVQGITLTAEQLGCAGDYVIFHADGSAELVMGGISVQTLGWKRGTVNVLGVDYEDGFSIDYYGTPYNFAVTETGLLMDYFGMLRIYEKTDGAAAPAAAPAADPYLDRKFLCTGSIVQGMKLTAEQLGCAGDYVIFKADGSVELVMSGIPVQTLGWTRGTVNVLNAEYEGFSVDYYGTIYNFAISEEGGLLLDYFGMVRTYEAE